MYIGMKASFKKSLQNIAQLLSTFLNLKFEASKYYNVQVFFTHVASEEY